MSDTTKSSASPQKLTWEDVVSAERGTVYVDRFEEGVRFLIMRGGGSLCAYLGIPVDHPLAGFNYELLPLQVHGGLTFGSEGDGKHHPKGFYWYGWDYGHCGDASVYDARFGYTKEAKKWTPADVEEDCRYVTYEFRNLMKLAELIAAKAGGKQ